MTGRNLFCLAVFLTVFDSVAQPQSASVFSGGLNSPMKFAMSSDGSLDPAEVFGHTTPYVLALDNAKRFLYVADAGGNRIIKVVGFLTGEPFAEGVAAVRLVNTTSGEVQPFINGLRSVMDVYYRDASPRPRFFVVEFRSFLIGPPMTGRVIQSDTPQGKIIASELIGPTGMAQDAATGEIFVVEFGANRVSLVKPQ